MLLYICKRKKWEIFSSPIIYGNPRSVSIIKLWFTLLCNFSLLFYIVSDNFFFVYDSKIMLHITNMEDGGQFGGPALIAWFYQRLHFFIGNTWIYILMTWLHQFKTTFLGRGKYMINCHSEFLTLSKTFNMNLITHFFPSCDWYILVFRVVAFFNRNCEDIAMCLLVANATNGPPVWVKGSCFFLSQC